MKRGVKLIEKKIYTWIQKRNYYQI